MPYTYPASSRWAQHPNTRRLWRGPGGQEIPSRSAEKNASTVTTCMYPLVSLALSVTHHTHMSGPSPTLKQSCLLWLSFVTVLKVEVKLTSTASHWADWCPSWGSDSGGRGEETTRLLFPESGWFFPPQWFFSAWALASSTTPLWHAAALDTQKGFQGTNLKWKKKEKNKK